tara:strand:+ start:227 stop:703 length:477 start_codon:yes stop_codon:yes gene_type:complete
MTKKKSPNFGHVVAQNRKARHNYHIQETFEAGLVLHGSEVKSLRHGKCSLGESYADKKNGELFLINSHIPEYAAASYNSHEPKATRKLLLKKRELQRLFSLIGAKGMTLVPLSIYFNQRGIAKIELGVAKGRDKVDKRLIIKDRDWKLQKARLMREKG